jgi:hypothetical protein
MKIYEFVEQFKNDKVINTQIKPNAVSDYLKEKLEIKDYVPFAEKRELCEKVLNVSNTRNDNGLVEVDSVTRYILFTLTIISKYTNLEFSSGEDEFDSLDEYDMLCQADLLNPILDVIGAEYTTCNNILNMMMTDVVANNNNIENVFGSATNRLLDTIDGFVYVLSEKVEELNLDLNQIDINKFKGLIDLLPMK